MCTNHGYTDWCWSTHRAGHRRPVTLSTSYFPALYRLHLCACLPRAMTSVTRATQIALQDHQTWTCTFFREHRRNPVQGGPKGHPKRPAIVTEFPRDCSGEHEPHRVLGKKESHGRDGRTMLGDPARTPSLTGAMKAESPEGEVRMERTRSAVHAVPRPGLLKPRERGGDMPCECLGAEATEKDDSTSTVAPSML